MKIDFVRTGGIAGIRLAGSFETDNLSGRQVRELQQLVDAARFFDMPEIPTPSTRIPDSLEYRLTISVGDETRAIVVAEPQVPADLRPLITYLVSLTKQRGSH